MGADCQMGAFFLVGATMGATMGAVRMGAVRMGAVRMGAVTDDIHVRIDTHTRV